MCNIHSHTETVNIVVVAGEMMSLCYLLISVMQMAVTWCGNTTGAEEEHELFYCVPAQVYSEHVCISSYKQDG